MLVLAFAGLTYAAIALRRRTAWHTRLMFCGMAEPTGPSWAAAAGAFPDPYVGSAVFAAVLVFVAIGMIADLRRNRRVHLAW